MGDEREREQSTKGIRWKGGLSMSDDVSFGADSCVSPFVPPLPPYLPLDILD